jgi:hypothetical protein
MGFLIWLEESSLGIFIRESLWGYPIVLSSHAVGMATVMGVVVALNFRALGYAKGISILAFDKLFIIGWVGFLINLISGLILFCNTPTTYFFQGSFQLKIAFIVGGGILMKVVMNSVRGETSENLIKVFSTACILCWFGGVITGRLMAYL